jgi:hypothetical protein
LGRAARGWASTDAGARCHLHSPPKNLGPDTDIVSRKINLKICVCGRAAQAQCARCFMQPYCSLNCQVRRSRPPHASHRGYTAADTGAGGGGQRLHWRVHREACYGRTDQGQSAMEAAAVKRHAERDIKE